MTEEWKKELDAVAKPEKISDLARFFKTGPGEYGEGDIFIGVYVPDNRRMARSHYEEPLATIKDMLSSAVHEHRLSGFLALVERYRKARTQEARDEVADFYLAHAERANNWDLVDLSAPYIMGTEWAAGRHMDDLRELCVAQLLWRRRIAVVGMLTVIRNGNIELALEICRGQLKHPHSLMQKAVGWILREAGKKDENALGSFLEQYIGSLSATALSYATERMPKEERVRFRQLRKARQKGIFV
ncbi:MAG: DNA alkylation repair protein [Muribaculaceae bacterium]|nr:DNA alkylation repair protein [Muribaculaceae bacterium]